MYIYIYILAKFAYMCVYIHNKYVMYIYTYICKWNLTKESKYSEILLNKNNVFLVIYIYIYILQHIHTSFLYI